MARRGKVANIFTEPPGLWDAPPLPERTDRRPAAKRLAALQRPPELDYPAAQAIRRRLLAVLDAVRSRTVPPRRFLLAGPADNGRTTFVKGLAATMEHECRGSAWVMPMPGRASYEGLWETIRSRAAPHEIRHQHEHSAMREYQAVRALASAAGKGLRLVVIDGADCLRDVSPKSRRLMLHAISSAGENAGVTIMMVGTPNLAAIVAPERDRSGYYDVIHFPRWRLDRAWIDLLSAWDDALPLRHRSGLARRELAKHLFALSDGRLGALSRILQAAAFAAIERGGERITIELLDDLGLEIPTTFSGFWF